MAGSDWGHRRWLRSEPRMLLLLAVLGLLVLLGEIVEDVVEGDTYAFDRSILLMLRSAVHPANPIGPAWAESAIVSITALGSTVVITMLTVLSAVYLLLVGRARLGIILACSVGLGAVAEHAMKLGFDRPRPELVPHLVTVTSLSFPSGHAMLSAVTYLSIGALLARTQPERRTRIFVLATASVLTLLIGFSRIYLGVHWPTDVLAGWIIGSLWALGFWAIAERLERTHAPR